MERRETHLPQFTDGRRGKSLRRWYNIDIEITDPEVYSSIYTGTIKNESYEEIFRLIEIACHVDCRIEHHYGKEAKPQITISKR